MSSRQTRTTLTKVMQLTAKAKPNRVSPLSPEPMMLMLEIQMISCTISSSQFPVRGTSPGRLVGQMVTSPLQGQVDATGNLYMADSDAQGEFAGGEYYGTVTVNGQASGTYEDQYAMMQGNWTATRQ